MTNADKFKTVFGIYSEEFWAKPEGDMLNWINSEYQKPQTNADRIRAMTDEELAKYLAWLVDKQTCSPEWLIWMKDEVKDV
jgi:hypothetical protein